MKRLHVNVAVKDIEASVRFYSSLFDTDPTVLKEDYARWMLEEPRVNFAITSRGARKGIDHLGIQVDTREELAEGFARLEAAGAPLIDQSATTCCYAQSEKSWSYDPDGIAWETFLTTGESPVYGSTETPAAEPGGACCDRPAIEGAAAGCCAGGIRERSPAAPPEVG